MNEQLAQKLKYLRLGQLLSQWDDYIKLASQKRYSHTRLLTHIVEEEYNTRRQNARQLRLKRANLPQEWALETYPFARQPKLNKKKMLALYDSFDYMTKNRNIIWIGPSGCGKTGLATSFLINAINRGYSARFVLFNELITELYSSLEDHSEQKLLKRYFKYDILLVDEVGYIKTEPAQVGLFFTLMHSRHQQKTTLITSNLGFSEWNSFFNNPHLTAALVDRLTADSYVVNMINCRGLRLPPTRI